MVTRSDENYRKHHHSVSEVGSIGALTKLEIDMAYKPKK